MPGVWAGHPRVNFAAMRCCTIASGMPRIPQDADERRKLAAERMARWSNLVDEDASKGVRIAVARPEIMDMAVAKAAQQVLWRREIVAAAASVEDYVAAIDVVLEQEPMDASR